MIALKKDSEAFNRHADVRIGLLREVIEKIQNGEEVDVEKVLGTGDPRKEATWEEGLQRPCRVSVVEQNMLTVCVVLQDIAREEVAITQKKKKQAEAAALAEAQAAASLKAAPEPSQPARVQPVSELSTKGFF